MVSLDGQVVNAGGSLTGGSRGRNSGLLSRASEIERVKEKAAALQQQAAKAQEEYRQRQEELSACEGQLSAARGELSSAQEERIRLQSEGARVAKELEQLAENAASLERERSDGAGRLRELAQREREIRAAIARLEEQVRQSQEENQRLTGSRQEQMAHCDEISQTIQEIRMGELSAQKDRDTLLAAVAGLEERKRDSAGAVERLRGEIAAYGEKLAQLEMCIRDSRRADHRRGGVYGVRLLGAAGRAEPGPAALGAGDAGAAGDHHAGGAGPLRGRLPGEGLPAHGGKLWRAAPLA